MGEYEIKVKEDLVGKKFGKLTVLSRAPDRISSRGRREAMWRCLCECGRATVVRDYLLRSGETKSCGCLKGQWCIKYNEYDLSGDYGVGYTYNGDVYYFDLEDYEKIKDYCWHLAKDGYICAIQKAKSKTIKMQWLVMDCIDVDHSKVIVDHINGIRHDNRRLNLRIVDRTLNNINKSMQSNNTSGVTGVYWSKQRNKWFAKLNKYHKQYHLGFFDNFEDAIAARKAGEEKYFGEYSYDNSRQLGGEMSSESLG